jgi:hypothetical protein
MPTLTFPQSCDLITSRPGRSIARPYSHSFGHLSYQTASWCKVTEYLYSKIGCGLYGQGGAAAQEGGEGWEC